MTTETPLPVTQNLELQVDSGDAFDVRDFAVNEGVNSLFSIDLVVRSSNPAVDFEATIGAQAKFRIGVSSSALGDVPSPTVPEFSPRSMCHSSGNCTQL